MKKIIIKDKPKAALLVLLWMVLSLAASYRWFGEGRDYLGYLHSYNQLGPYSFWNVSRFEPGYTILAWIFKFYLGASYSQFTFVLVSLALGLKLLLIWRYTTTPILATFVYALLFYPMLEYTAIRVAVALGFTYLGLHHSLRGNLYSAAMLFFLGVIFHYSVVVLVIAACVYLFLRHNIYLFIIGSSLVLALPSIALFTGLGDFSSEFNPLTIAYLENAASANTPNIFSLSIVLFFATLVSSVFFLRPWKDEYAYLWFYFSVIGLLYFFFLLNSPVLAHRIKDIFLLSTIFLTFRFHSLSLRTVPVLFMVMNGLWFFYRTITLGIISI